jgi:hypothetical protein
MMGLTTEEIMEKQRQMFDEVNLYQNSDVTSNNDIAKESPVSVSVGEENSGAMGGYNEEYLKTWQDFKENWMQHNMPVL